MKDSILKEATIDVAKFFTEVGEIAEDKKVTIPEALGIIPDFLTLGKYASKFPELAEEITTLNSEDYSEISEAFAAEFDLDNNNTEQCIEDAFQIISSVAALIVNIGKK